MPEGFVTVTSYTPPGSAGVTASKNELKTGPLMVMGTPPIAAVRPLSKLVPKNSTDVPPAPGPEDGVTVKGSLWENSDVRPFESVAVAEMRAPCATDTGRVTSKASGPVTTVRGAEPSHVSPSRYSRGSSAHGGFS